MTDLPDASTIKRAIEERLIADYPRYRTYWECRTPNICVHPGWVGSNWTWSALTEPDDTRLIAYAAELVRKQYPRAAI